MPNGIDSHRERRLRRENFQRAVENRDRIAKTVSKLKETVSNLADSDLDTSGSSERVRLRDCAVSKEDFKPLVYREKGWRYRIASTLLGEKSGKKLLAAALLKTQSKSAIKSSLGAIGMAVLGAPEFYVIDSEARLSDSGEVKTLKGNLTSESVQPFGYGENKDGGQTYLHTDDSDNQERVETRPDKGFEVFKNGFRTHRVRAEGFQSRQSKSVPWGRAEMTFKSRVKPAEKLGAGLGGAVALGLLLKLPTVATAAMTSVGMPAQMASILVNLATVPAAGAVGAALGLVVFPMLLTNQSAPTTEQADRTVVG